MMKIDKYIDSIMDKINKANGYSEMTDDSLRDIIRDYLLDEHDKELNSLAVKMEMDRMNGNKIDLDYYHEQYDKVKGKMLSKVEELSWMGEAKKLITSTKDS